MKILAGNWRGRQIKQPPDSVTRPLSEKVRAAIFDIIGSPAGLSVLDAYAGSGAAGFEALSRGATLVESIESNAKAARVIAENAKTLGADWGYFLHQVSVETWLASPSQQPSTPRYNLIIADPPYSKLEPDILDKLAQYLQPAGIMVISHSSRLKPPALEKANLIKSKTYGDSELSIYEPTSSS